MEPNLPFVAWRDFGPEAWIQLAATLLLLSLSALASGAETSFFSLTQTDVQKLKERRSAGSEAILKLLSNVDLLLATKIGRAHV